MAQKLDQDELVGIRELVVANSTQVDAISVLLIEKGFFKQDEYFTKLKQVQAEYKSKDNV